MLVAYHVTMKQGPDVGQPPLHLTICAASIETPIKPGEPGSILGSAMCDNFFVTQPFFLSIETIVIIVLIDFNFYRNLT